MAGARAGELSVNGACMAILIPSLGFARFDTRGELRLAERLKDFLEENAVVWHNLPVGPRSRHPDFIIVHPAMRAAWEKGIELFAASLDRVRH